MNFSRYLLIMVYLVSVSQLRSQSCTSSFIYQNTVVSNTVWFKDQSLSNQISWQREYTEWNFNDGSLIDTNKILVHTFPTGNIYNVVKTTKFSQISNPLNFCIVKDSMYVDASLTIVTCLPQNKMKVTWLTDSTYGVASYISGCAYNLKEIAVTMGNGIFVPSSGPMPSIFSSSQNFFTFTLPRRDTAYAFTHHIILVPTSTSSTSMAMSKIIPKDSIPKMTGNCHAAFFMMPADSTFNNWVVQNYSSGSGPLTYFWDFGDGNTSTLVNPAHTYSTVGTYTVCLTVTSGTCSDTFCSTALTDTSQIGYGMKQLNMVNMNVGVKESAHEINNLTIYPNPSKGVFNFEFNISVKDQTLEVFNLYGQSVLSETLNGDKYQIDLSSNPSGIYFIRIAGLTKKIVIE
ncbi:MAG: T9SS type A sorting domain-containing protein [Sphingobacteriaceae bacterium]|nr:T9SS type A sorting domain-containing protein [Sphingobacteriaceae bacterium]